MQVVKDPQWAVLVVGVRATLADGVNFIPYIKFLGWSKNIFIPKTQFAPAVSLFSFPNRGPTASASPPPPPNLPSLHSHFVRADVVRVNVFIACPADGSFGCMHLLRPDSIPVRGGLDWILESPSAEANSAPRSPRFRRRWRG
jgi:hypothetical protein